MNIKIIGIDLAKNVFQICALSPQNKVVFNCMVRRSRLLDQMRQIEPCFVAMETCGSANYWGRQLQALGHTVKLIPAQHVKAFVRVSKNDANDALAIAEAAQRPGLHWVPIKSLEQQDLAMLHRLRQHTVERRTAKINQLRGLAAEYGVIFPLGRQALLKAVPLALEDAENELTSIAREVLNETVQDIRDMDKRVQQLTARLQTAALDSEVIERLQTIPGIGPIVASAIVAAVGDGKQFGNGRCMAAATGLVPRQYSSGGKIRLGKITKNGDRYLRYQLINGARPMVVWAAKRDDAMGRWIMRLKARSSFNNAVVALANKLARIAWSVLTQGEDFDLRKAFAG